MKIEIVKRKALRLSSGVIAILVMMLMTGCASQAASDDKTVSESGVSNDSTVSLSTGVNDENKDENLKLSEDNASVSNSEDVKTESAVTENQPAEQDAERAELEALINRFKGRESIGITELTKAEHDLLGIYYDDPEVMDLVKRIRSDAIPAETPEESSEIPVEMPEES